MPIKLKQSNNFRRFYSNLTTSKSWYALQVGAFGNRSSLHAKGKNNKISNAGLLFITEVGSPLQNIPARPVVRPALQAKKAFIKQKLTLITKMIAKGASPWAVRQQYNEIGRVLVDEIRDNISAGGVPYVPLAPSTIKQRMRYGIAPSVVPLDDTGQLWHSIKYRVVSSSGDIEDEDNTINMR